MSRQYIVPEHYLDCLHECLLTHISLSRVLYYKFTFFIHHQTRFQTKNRVIALLECFVRTPIKILNYQCLYIFESLVLCQNKKRKQKQIPTSQRMEPVVYLTSRSNQLTKTEPVLSNCELFHLGLHIKGHTAIFFWR